MPRVFGQRAEGAGRVAIKSQATYLNYLLHRSAISN
jgi:hypothetical protein